MAKQTPGIIARSSNLIIIQVIFIFVALALILFPPRQDHPDHSGLIEQERQLMTTGRAILDALDTGELELLKPEELNREAINEFMARRAAVNSAAVIDFVDSATISVVYAYHRTDSAGKQADPVESDVSAIANLEIMEQVAGGSDPGVGATFINGEYISYYCRLGEKREGTARLFILASPHGLSLSSRSNLMYAVFLLFLVSTLISLLTVALLTAKFKRPLDRIISGFEETADGKLHRLNDMEDDPQLGKLVIAYNRMTAQLWEQRCEIDSFVERLGRTNAELSESQQFLRVLIDSSPQAVIVTDPDNKIVMFNQAAGETFGYDAEEVLGHPFKRLIASGREAWPHSISNGVHRESEVVGRRQNGDHFPLYIVSRQVKNEQGETTARVYVCRDITESKNFQDMMIRLDRYYTRGEMAGDIAHEINNYLAVLMGNVELMPLMLKKGNLEKVEKKLEVMHQTLEKIARFADGLLDSPPETVRLEPTSMNQVIQNVIAFLKPQNKFDEVEIITSLADDLPVLQLDQMQIQQLLVNLIYNAAESLYEISGEKKIEIGTRISEFGGDPGVLVEVRDNGPGVAPDREELLFKTRFTTKKRGHGIGLITCRKIVNNHEGNIEYRHDGGAVFCVKLPVGQVDPELEAAAAARGM